MWTVIGKYSVNQRLLWGFLRHGSPSEQPTWLPRERFPKIVYDCGLIVRPHKGAENSGLNASSRSFEPLADSAQEHFAKVEELRRQFNELKLQQPELFAGRQLISEQFADLVWTIRI